MTKRSHDDQPNTETELVEEEDLPVTPEQISKVVNLAREQYKLDKEIERKEKELKDLNAALQKNKTVDLPAAMQDARMTECPLDEGYKIELVPIVHASVPSPNNKKVPDAVERNERGIAYLDKVAPDLVVTKLEIIFNRNEHKELKRFLGDNKRRKKPLEMNLTRTVNTATLGKWVRERDAAALETDDTAISIHRMKVAELIAPKKPKAI